ncbi:MAG TPA: cation:proton antiporter [Acholeplasma sp.]|nr:cation:proton antiporter [Acholeplasma sp.]
MELLILKVAIILVVGFIGGKVAEKYKLPSVSGYLVFGLFLGPSVGLIFKGFEGVITAQDQDSLKFISEIALSFIAFSIGSEFNLKRLLSYGKNVTSITNHEVLFAVVLVFLTLFFIPKPAPIMNGYEPFSRNNIAIGLIFASMSAATAPAATLMVMRQYRAYGPVTKTILPVVAMDDIHGIVIFGFLISIAKMLTSGETSNVFLMFAKPFAEVFGSILLGGIIGYILVFVTKKIKKSMSDYQIVSVTAILLTMSLVLVFNNLLSKYDLSFSTLLTNMMVGAMVANLIKKPDDTFASVNNFTSPFFVIFFTIAGASLDLGILKTSFLVSILALVYILARGFGKYFGAYVGAKKRNMEPTVQKYIGFALLPQGGVSLGLLVIVMRQMPNFYPLISTIIMLSILVYETTGPIFAKIAISKAGEINGLDRLEELSSVDDL